MNTADRAAATARSAACPVSGKVRLRAPPGGMSARSRAGSRCKKKSGCAACMKPALFLPFGLGAD